MKYLGGSAFIVTIEYNDEERNLLEFGTTNKKYVFTEWGKAYYYIKHAIEKAMYDDEVRRDNKGRNIDECIRDGEAIFDSVKIDCERATLVVREKDDFDDDEDEDEED